jgi:hypothetical protein
MRCRSVLRLSGLSGPYKKCQSSYLPVYDLHVRNEKCLPSPLRMTNCTIQPSSKATSNKEKAKPGLAARRWARLELRCKISGTESKRYDNLDRHQKWLDSNLIIITEYWWKKKKITHRWELFISLMPALRVIRIVVSFSKLRSWTSPYTCWPLWSLGSCAKDLFLS